MFVAHKKSVLRQRSINKVQNSMQLFFLMAAGSKGHCYMKSLMQCMRLCVVIFIGLFQKKKMCYQRLSANLLSVNGLFR